MNTRSKGLCVLFSLIAAVFFFAVQAHAATPIAKVSRFTGKVIVKSGQKITLVKNVGHVIYDGDILQTEKSEVQITYNDGALMKVKAYSSVRIVEREEKTGWWIFKTKKLARRMHCFVGKMWFKSGASKRKNYLETPTAICGLRGSAAWSGYFKGDTYYLVVEGVGTFSGKWKSGMPPASDLANAMSSGDYKKIKEFLEKHMEDVKETIDEKTKVEETTETVEGTTETIMETVRETVGLSTTTSTCPHGE